jgi:cell division septation protein DedD
MRAESGGQLYQNGQLTTSWVGAMGLMQVMPETYDELRGRYALGDDAYDPHNNILAGTAYIREMYDLYGSPGFLAAYNGGPARLDDYLNNVRPLPDETRHYVAKIGPNIAGIYPERRSPAEDLAMNQLPIDIPGGIRYPRPATHLFASRNTTRPAHQTEPDHRRETEIAEARPSRTSPPPGSLALPPPPPRVETAMATSRTSGGMHLIAPAMADTVPVRHGGPSTGSWAVQVGAFGNESQARNAAAAAHGEARDARTEVGTVHQAHGTLYRARLTGLSRDAAIQACEKLSHGHGNCIVLSPASQS